MRKLVIFELDNILGTLLCGDDAINIPDTYTRSYIDTSSIKGTFVVRPFVRAFIEHLILHGYYVAVWGIRPHDYVTEVINKLFHGIDWKFVWSVDDCLSSSAHVKNLNNVISRYPSLRQDTMMLLYDSDYETCQTNGKLDYICLHVPKFEIDVKEDYFKDLME